MSFYDEWPAWVMCRKCEPSRRPNCLAVTPFPVPSLPRITTATSPGLSAQTFIYLTKNIFPARFRDRQDHQITGANDGPIVQELRAPDLMSIADPREALKQFEQFRSSLALAAPAQTRH
jgi:hypothetical protein